MGSYVPHAFTYGLQDVCRRLGESVDAGRARTERWQVSYVNGLIDRYGFPPPNPLMIGTRWHDGAHASSRWPQVAVDQWFEDRLPPDAAAAEERRLRRAAEVEMASAATGLADRMKAANMRVAA